MGAVLPWRRPVGDKTAKWRARPQIRRFRSRLSSQSGKKPLLFPYFPVLIKLIDARTGCQLRYTLTTNTLCVSKACTARPKCGTWWTACPARLIYGLTRVNLKGGVSPQGFDGTVTEVCNFVPVSKGDVFFIEAGTLHAIGAGILIAEVARVEPQPDVPRLRLRAYWAPT